MGTNIKNKQKWKSAKSDLKNIEGNYKNKNGKKNIHVNLKIAKKRKK